MLFETIPIYTNHWAFTKNMFLNINLLKRAFVALTSLTNYEEFSYGDALSLYEHNCEL